MRSLQPDREAIIAEVQRLLQGNEPPTFICCRRDFYAHAAFSAIESLGLRGRVELVSAQAGRGPSRLFPCVEPIMPAAQQLAEVGRRLLALVAGENIDPLRMLVPVKLESSTSPH